MKIEIDYEEYKRLKEIEMYYNLIKNIILEPKEDKK